VRLPYPPYDVLVALVDGHPTAIEDACAHAGASLCAGWRLNDSLEPDDQGPNIACPVHAYIFSLKTGELLQPANLCDNQRPFKAHIEGEDVIIHDDFTLAILPP
jgi:nitrite reductase/ring-hydroxylating ferredoxin subunit